MTILRLVAAKALAHGKPDLRAVAIDVDQVTGKIIKIDTATSPRRPREQDDVQEITLPEDCYLLPGLVDCHVHLNQPGRTAWEGFETGSLAAVSGGVTTIVDMPLNSIPPTTTIENLRSKRDAARTVGVQCDLAFWGGIIPGNHTELLGLLEAGVKGFKCFLIDSGVEEFPHVDEADLHLACEALTGTNALILFHAELGTHEHQLGQGDNSNYDTFLHSRPQSLELDALELVLRLAKRYPDLRFHIVHLSAASALPRIRQARRDGVRNLTVETCFHYLTLRAEDIAPDATQYKCCPPIREENNRRELLAGLFDGTIDFVVSDHSPCIPELKQGDFMSAWGGVSGLGLGLSLMWTELSERVHVRDLLNWLSTRQAEQVGLDRKKGRIEVGYDADFVLFDPDEIFTVGESDLYFKNKVSPYLGRRLRGRVRQTFLRGRLVWDLDGGVATGNLSQGHLI